MSTKQKALLLLVIQKLKLLGLILAGLLVKLLIMTCAGINRSCEWVLPKLTNLKSKVEELLDGTTSTS